MGLQEEAMRKNANKLYGAHQDEEGWYGFEEVNHPTPSGCERWLMTYSDKRRWHDSVTAVLKIKEALGVK